MITVIVFLVVGLPLGTIAHEVGHALCATMVGIPIRFVKIGHGAVILRGKIGRTSFTLRWLPMTGFAQPFPILIIQKYKLALFCLGGALGNFALIFLVALLNMLPALPDVIRENMGAIVFAQLFLIVLNLTPYRLKKPTAEGISTTDGLSLARCLLGPSGVLTAKGLRYSQMLASYNAVGNPPSLRSAASARIAYYLESPERWTQSEARRDIRNALLGEISAAELPLSERLIVLEALVTIGLVTGDLTYRSELDQWSLTAMQLAPMIKTVRGSRGAALVELGRFEEGKSLLLQVADPSAPSDYLMGQFFLARAERGLGNELDPRCLFAAVRAIPAAYLTQPPISLALAQIEAMFGRASE
jgi:Peptidase family M50